MNPTVITTADGSSTLFREDLNEHYHSVNGAIQESRHVFINAGLNYMYAQNNNLINILEVGFGTGLNALLTLIESEKHSIRIGYNCLEPYPLSPKIISQLNYLELLDATKYEQQFNSFHKNEIEFNIELSPRFSFSRATIEVQEIIMDEMIHLIYFDAFAPNIQPELWTEDVFSRLYNIVLPNGCLVTYCAKGEVKRILKKVGFAVESLKGPPGKREMIRAVK